MFYLKGPKKDWTTDKAKFIALLNKYKAMVGLGQL